MKSMNLTGIPWIECNLPYDIIAYVDDKSLPKPPDVSDQERAEFKKSVEELEALHGKDKFDALDDLLIEEVTWSLSRKLATRKAETAAAAKAGMSDVLKAKRLIQKIEQWRDTLPEYMAWKDHHAAEFHRLLSELKSQTFDGQGLAKPGTQIEVDGKLYLIGDINPNLGTCDDCTAFDIEAIVTRYRVLIPIIMEEPGNKATPKCSRCEDKGGCSSCNECGLCHACKKYHDHDDTCMYSGLFGPLLMHMEPDEWHQQGAKEVTGPGWYWRTWLQWHGPFDTKEQAKQAKETANGNQ